ncbi:MAG: hypothetical protein ABR973_16175 [Candidatus Acidiferrales bacterium]|jgi:hypothetical protein
MSRPKFSATNPPAFTALAAALRYADPAEQPPACPVDASGNLPGQGAPLVEAPGTLAPQSSHIEPRPSQPVSQTSSLSHHERRCTICHHPDRDAIEEEFIHWHSLIAIERVYDIERRSLYRHAHAFNLFARRNRNLRFALGHIIQRVELADIGGADTVIRAIHEFARINDAGECNEPPKHVIFSSADVVVRPPAAQSVRSNRHSVSNKTPAKLLKTKGDDPRRSSQTRRVSKCLPEAKR